MARLLMMLACVISGGAALAQSSSTQSGQQLLLDQQRQTQALQERMSLERQINSYELRQRMVNTNRPTYGTTRTLSPQTGLGGVPRTYGNGS